VGKLDSVNGHEASLLGTLDPLQLQMDQGHLLVALNERLGGMHRGHSHGGVDVGDESLVVRLRLAVVRAIKQQPRLPQQARDMQRRVPWVVVVEQLKKEEEKMERKQDRMNE
jgi:hypothetical protein